MQLGKRGAIPGNQSIVNHIEEAHGMTYETFRSLEAARRWSLRRRLGIPSIGIEIDERHCEIAANRCRQDTLGLEAG